MANLETTEFLPGLLSIIIVSFSTCKLLESCLESIRAHVRCPFEVWVVDNGSRDDSISMVRSRFPRVHLIANEVNRGFAAANNQALRQASGEFVLLLNSDAQVIDESVDKMIEFLQSRSDVGVVGPRLVDAAGAVQPSGFPFPSLVDVWSETLLLDRLVPCSRFQRRKEVAEGTDAEREVDWVSGACLMVRRAAINRAGLLDESYFMYAEEVDWCRRIKEAGYRVLLLPGATVMHIEQGSREEAGTRVSARAVESRLRYFHKHHGSLYTVAVRFVSVIGLLMRSTCALPGVFQGDRMARRRLAIYCEATVAALSPIQDKQSLPAQEARR